MQLKVAVVIALGIEANILKTLRGGVQNSSIDLYQCGPGAARATEAARAAVEAGAGALVSWGLAGGLVPELAPGTVLLPKRILVAAGEPLDTDPDWRASVVEAMGLEFAVHDGDLLTADDVLKTPRMKASAARSSGGVAVDMESAAIAQVAANADLPVIVLRVVADGANDYLPANIDQWIDARGQRRLAPALGVVFRPSQWSTLLILARRYRVAQSVLTKLAQRLVPLSFAVSPRSVRYS